VHALAAGLAAAGGIAWFWLWAWAEESFGFFVDEPGVSFEVPAVVDREGVDGDRAVVWVEPGAAPV